MRLITDIDEARRVADQVVGDVAFYNREKIRLALREDRLFTTLAAELAEAHAIYADRVDPEIEALHNFFNRAIVDMIIKPFENEETTIW